MRLKEDFETLSLVVAEVAPDQVFGDATLPNFTRLLVVAVDVLPENETIARLLDLYDLEIITSPLRQIIGGDGRICKVKAEGGGPATGFLVGPDLVMTAAHVLRRTEGVFFPPESVELTFDYFTPTGDDLATPTAVRLADDWLLAHSLAPMDDGRPPAPNELDYLIVRIAASLGSSATPSGSERRGWFDGSTAPVAPAVGQTVSIRQHPNGYVLSEASGPVNKLVFDSTRVLYEATTFNSSSGSPVLDDAQNVVALHLWNDRFADDHKLLNEGATFAAIHADLAAKGITLPAL